MQLKKLFILTVALSFLGLTAQAQSELKIVTVNLEKALNGYYKTDEARKKLLETEAKAVAGMEELQTNYTSMVEEYQEMQEQSENVALTESARAKAAEDAQNKISGIRAKQGELEQYRNNAQRALQQMDQNHRTLMLEDIQKVIKVLAYEREATLVLDESGLSSMGASVVLYSSAAYDITDDILAILNSDKPVEIQPAVE
ncbi:MAG: OmpH family outer membrane protein [Opitutaceae bacterium]|nr:OmpH family outer membrane protein [Opitutaceae bacterium]